MNLSVIVPVYNSQDSLSLLVDRLEPVLKKNSEQYELILINDGSKDRSWDVIRSLSDKHAWIKPVNLMRNYGQHNAILCGIRHAAYEVIVTIDDDLQHPPEEIPKLLNKLQEGFDVVYGTPRQEKHGFFRNFASIFTKWALQASMETKVAKSVSAFRAIRTQTRNAFVNFQSPFVSIDVLLTWGTTRFSAVQIPHDIREMGSSNYTFRKLFTHAFNMITGFSTLPLQLASLFGFLFMFFGVGILFYILINFFYRGGGVEGFTFLASIITIFSGVQLFVLGIIGEYLSRIHFRTFNKPPYVERTKV